MRECVCPVNFVELLNRENVFPTDFKTTGDEAFHVIFVCFPVIYRPDHRRTL